MVCSPNPCQNGGICSAEAGTYTCTCPATYTGRNCETRDFCLDNPCMNGYVCENFPPKQEPMKYICCEEKSWSCYNDDDNCPNECNALKNDSICQVGLFIGSSDIYQFDNRSNHHIFSLNGDIFYHNPKQNLHRRNATTLNVSWTQLTAHKTSKPPTTRGASAPSDGVVVSSTTESVTPNVTTPNVTTMEWTVLRRLRLASKFLLHI